MAKSSMNFYVAIRIQARSDTEVTARVTVAQSCLCSSYALTTAVNRSFPQEDPSNQMYPFATKRTYTPPGVQLHSQIRSPVVAIDHRWCFSKPLTLHLEENPFTRIVRVWEIETHKTLLEIHRVHSPVGDLFQVVDAETHEQLVTVDGFGFRGCFDIFRGEHKQSTKRTNGPILVDASCAHVTAYFDDADARRPTRAIVDGRWGDRTAVVAVHHAVSSQPIARINRPHHLWLKMPYYTIEIAPGVDILLPIMLWLGRWVQYERQQLAAAYSKVSDWSVVCV